MRRCVLTGGPHAGKTTLLEELARRGHRVVPEAALEVIESLTAEHGLEGQRIWREEHPDEFQARIVEVQVRREAELGPGLVFLDRGLLDGLAYCAARGRAAPAALTRHVASGGRRYERVLVLDTILPFDPRSGTGRTSTEAMALEYGRLLFETYAAHGYDPVRVPMLPLAARADRVLGLAG